MSDLLPLLRSAGFGEALAVSGRAHVDDLFTQRSRGLYVLHLPAWNGRAASYIGQTVDFRSRFRQHLRGRFPRIDAVSFLPVPDGDLDQLERDTIHRLRTTHFLLNIRDANPPPDGASRLDEVIPLAVRERWLADVEPVDDPPLGGPRRIDEAQRERYRPGYRRYLTLPDHGWATLGLLCYAAAGLPLPHDTERTWWAVSCNPSPGVLARINIGWHEVATAYRTDEEGGPAFVFCLASDVVEPELERLLRDYPLLAVDGRYYPSGNPDQLFLSCDNLMTFAVLLGEPVVVRAVRRYNLDLMRRTKAPPTIRDAHCYDLATDLLDWDLDRALQRFVAAAERTGGSLDEARELARLLAGEADDDAA